MTWKAYILAAATSFYFYCADAMAQTSDGWKIVTTRRLCTGEDLSGTFTLHDYKQDPPGPDTEILKQFPYQYLRFYPTHYNAISLARAVDSALQLEQTLALLPSAASRKYVLHDSGVLDIYNGKTYISYRCLVSIAAVDGFQKGDIIMTANTGEGGTLYKVYRRWY